MSRPPAHSIARTLQSETFVAFPNYIKGIALVQSPNHGLNTDPMVASVCPCFFRSDNSDV